jgi:hypothetical protein
MRRLLLATVVVVLATAAVAQVTRSPDGSRPPGSDRANTGAPVGGVRFDTIDVFIDPKGQPLAAYQFELAAKAGVVKIVGLEGNAALPFNDPPYYDPAAMQRDRVIVAAFSTADEGKLPHGKVRVATVHVQIEGSAKPAYELKLNVAGNPAGDEIQAEATLTEGTGS